MRYGREYDRGYGRGSGYGEVGRGPETNWMGRNYRSPGEPRRGYDASFGAGHQPRHGGWNVERPGRGGYDRGYAAYDRPYRPLGGMHRGYDRGYRGGGGYDAGMRGYDRGDRELGGMSRGRAMGGGLNDPYGPYRMLQSRSAAWGSPWPGRFFTDHGHNTGPY